MDPLISVIVPVYKVEDYLDRCLNSVVSQTYENLEIILVDDGSPDSCPQMCDEWRRKDTRIKVIHKENGGLSSARNAGLRIACGSCIHFLDSDDWIEHDMYEHMIGLFERYPEADMVKCDAKIVSNEREFDIKDKEVIEIFNKEKMFNYFFRINGEKSNTGVWDKLIKRQILEGFLFVDTLNEDVEASLEFYLRSNCMIVTNRIYYHYYINKTGISRSSFSLKDLDYLSVWDRVVERTKHELPEYYDYAVLYRKRANFTMLTKMRLRGFDKTDKQLRMIYNELKNQARKDYLILMKSKLPISRKVLLTLECI